METCERETIICINEADRQDGWFSFGTSDQRALGKMLKKIGGEQNLFCPIKTSTQDGKIVYWSCQVPVKYLSKSNFGIKSPSKRKGISRPFGKALPSGQPQAKQETK